MQSDSQGEIIVNPTYQKNTTKDVWETLSKNLSSINPSCIVHLHNHLHNNLKCTISIGDYVQEIRRTCDELVAARHLIQEIMSIYALLRGLGPSYAAFNASITSNLHNLCFADVVTQIYSHDELVTFSNPSRDIVALEFPPTTNQTQFNVPDHGQRNLKGEIIKKKGIIELDWRQKYQSLNKHLNLLQTFFNHLIRPNPSNTLLPSVFPLPQPNVLSPRTSPLLTNNLIGSTR
ncbi:unnamed protein product [Spirodela intermedia]|uniref:Uncharacterized protein n=1 Tax=Spirodela intermedia TaxID=51605 RepID=A0A7I8K733_SPIIN|nr:unnamed protein product [Spirodela intermedia]